MKTTATIATTGFSTAAGEIGIKLAAGVAGRGRDLNSPMDGAGADLNSRNGQWVT
jgi:hypothetical protein